MQLTAPIGRLLLLVLCALKLTSHLPKLRAAPTDHDQLGGGGGGLTGLAASHLEEPDEQEAQQQAAASLMPPVAMGDSGDHHSGPHLERTIVAPAKSAAPKYDDYYQYRHMVAAGVQKALDECREKFKWDRWNCPKKAFLDVLVRNPAPANKELGLTRALIASGIVIALTKTCSYGNSQYCGCSQSQVLEARAGLLATANLPPRPVATRSISGGDQFTPVGNETAAANDKVAKFEWRGCDEIVKFAFKVSKTYLEAQDWQDEVSRKINAHNYEAGRLAVKRNMRRVCKCHGISGSCQVNTCWTTLPDMGTVGEYLKRQYRQAAKVGAMSTEETNLTSLRDELQAINTEKLVFAEASPDYCYEHPQLGINGTLNRLCSKKKLRDDGTPVSRAERDSCDRLCTKCGYRVKRERFETEKQCNCRFIYCCSVECERCPHVEDTWRCVRHS